MKLRFLFTIFIVLVSSITFAQSEFNKTVRDSKAFRAIAETLALEPGSIHIINTTYIIEADGSLSNITAAAEYPELEPEAIRIIGTLPKHNTPKNSKGAYARRTISMKITYQVESLLQKKLRLRKEARVKKKN